MRLLSFPTLVAAALIALAPAHAVAQESTEERLREALRSATIQQRALEDERTRLQAQNAEYERLIQALQAEVAARPDPAAVAAMEVDFNSRLETKTEAISQLGGHLDQLRGNLGQLSENLENWKAAYEEAANIARTTEAARAQLEAQNVVLTERATSCEVKNAELFNVGNEILDRYSGVSLADTLAIREPFVGFKRVELQNLVQDYQDKLLDQRVTP